MSTTTADPTAAVTTVPTIYPAIVTQQDLAPDHFGAEVDDVCEEIKDATAGWGANKEKVIQALASQDATTRHKIAIRYPELYSGKTLDELMRKEFAAKVMKTSDFATAMELLALPLDKAEAAMIKKATAGIGASPKIIFSILCGRTNAEIDHLKKTYYNMYGRDLGSVLASELHGDNERLVFNCLQGSEETFDPQYHTPDKAAEDAEEIHSKGIGKTWGTEERGIFKIICKSPPQHLAQINQAYADKFGFTLEKAMEKEFSGPLGTGMMEQNVRKACLHTVAMKLKPYPAMAQLIKAACAGFGTDEMLLTCCIIRYQGQLAHVQTAHIELFQKTIHERVRDECGGKYKDLLLTILNSVWPEE